MTLWNIEGFHICYNTKIIEVEDPDFYLRRSFSNTSDKIMFQNLLMTEEKPEVSEVPEDVSKVRSWNAVTHNQVLVNLSLTKILARSLGSSFPYSDTPPEV